MTAQRESALREALLNVQGLVGLLALPLASLLPQEQQRLVPVFAIAISVIVVLGIALVPGWPRPSWMRGEAFNNISLDVGQAHVAVLLPPGDKATDLEQELRTRYNDQGVQLLRFHRADTCADGELWPEEILEDDPEAIVIADDGNWKLEQASRPASPRSRLLTQLLSWAQANPTKPVIGIVLDGDIGSLPFGVVAIERVWPDRGPSWYLMNSLLSRATVLSRYWKTEADRQRRAVRYVALAASFAAFVVVIQLVWTMKPSEAAMGVEEISANRLATAAADIAGFWTSHDSVRSHRSKDMVSKHARMLSTWVRSEVRLSEHDSPRIVVVHRRFGAGGTWGLVEAGSADDTAGGTLPDSLTTFDGGILGIGYCAAHGGIAVAWRGRDDLDGAPRTDTIVAWVPGDTLSAGTYDKQSGLLQTKSAKCRYVAGKRDRDQRRRSLLCEPVPFGASVILGVVCISLNEQADFLWALRTRQRLAHFGFDLAPYLALVPVDTTRLRTRQ